MNKLYDVPDSWISMSPEEYYAYLCGDQEDEDRAATEVDERWKREQEERD